MSLPYEPKDTGERENARGPGDARGSYVGVQTFISISPRVCIDLPTTMATRSNLSYILLEVGDNIV